MKKILLYLILLMAVGLAGTVAYVSVTGLMKVFTGAGTAGLIFFIGVEVAKVVSTSAVHTYGKRIGWLYSGLLSLGILVSMAITSMGIYGFLSSSYKESYSKMENVNSKIELLEQKKEGYKEQLVLVTKEKDGLTQTISELSKGLSNNFVQHRDQRTGQVMTTTSSANRKVLQDQLDKALKRQEGVNEKSDTLSKRVFDLENEMLEIKLGDGSSSELSTLQYLSDITGASMDTVMSWFIFLLIIIGDPMAVLMVIVFNKVINFDKVDSTKEVLTDLADALNNEPSEGVSDDELFQDMGNYINPNTGEIDLSGPIKPMSRDIHFTSPNYDEVNNDYLQEIQNNLKYGTPITNDAVSEAVNDAVSEAVDIVEEDSLPPVITDEEILKEMIDSNKVIVDSEVEITPEEQIAENTQEVKQLTREPIIPRGEILKEDLISEDRGFSVKIPNPKTDGDTTHFFPRRRNDELGNG
jgi:hypothetical protein